MDINVHDLIISNNMMNVNWHTEDNTQIFFDTKLSALPPRYNSLFRKITVILYVYTEYIFSLSDFIMS